MNEYIFEPKSNNTLAKILVVTCGLMAVGLWSISGLEGVPMPPLWQMGAVVLLVVAIMLITRYLVKGFIYTFYKDSEDELDDMPDLYHWAFKIVEYQSKTRRRVVCHLDAKDIVSITIVDSEQSKQRAKETAKGLKIYNYCVEMCPKNYAEMIMLNGDETLCVRFSPNKEMVEAMLQLISHKE